MPYCRGFSEYAETETLNFEVRARKMGRTSVSWDSCGCSRRISHDNPPSLVFREILGFPELAVEGTWRSGVSQDSGAEANSQRDFKWVDAPSRSGPRSHGVAYGRLCRRRGCQRPAKLWRGPFVTFTTDRFRKEKRSMSIGLFRVRISMLCTV